MASRAIFNWSRGINGPSVSFHIKYKIGNGSFKHANTTDTTFEIDNLKPKSQVTFKVRSVGVAPNNKKSKFVSVLVKPDEFILKEMQKLNFDYFQIYDCTPDEIKSIKKKYNKSQ